MALTFNPIDPSIADFESIISSLLSDGIDLVSGSVSFQGSVGQSATFEDGMDSIGLQSGLLLTSGSASVPTTNTSTGFSSQTGSGTDADLLAAGAGLPGISTVNDANTISFQVITESPEITSISFRFVFGSDEFPEYSSNFSDIAAIFVNGTNIALFGNGNPLAVIDDNLAAGNFQNNQAGSIAIEYDGISTVLSVTAPLVEGVNTIKIGVADSNDLSLDSGLFVASIGGGGGDGGSITLPPIAEDDEADTNAGTAVTIAVLANDSDPDGVIASQSITSAPGNGTAVFNEDGTVDYTPNAGFTGTDSFTYTVFDDDGASDTATVTVSVGDDTSSPSDCPTVDRPGTVDLSASSNDVVSGASYHNTFFVDTSAASGKDRITNFGPDDILVTTTALFDSNGDGLHNFGKNKLLDVDGIDTKSDTIAFDGIDPTQGLRFLGEACEGNFVYADATVRPVGALEGYVLSDDILSGDETDQTSEAFFFDTALDLDLGNDLIANFGSKDILVTTTKIFGGNNDDLIGFGANKLLDLPGGVGGPGDPGLPGEGGLVEMFGIDGALVTKLEYDGVVTSDGVDYHVYSLVGSSAGTDDLMLQSAPLLVA